jgi:hypothetical protein
MTIDEIAVFAACRPEVPEVDDDVFEAIRVAVFGESNLASVRPAHAAADVLLTLDTLTTSTRPRNRRWLIATSCAAALVAAIAGVATVRALGDLISVRGSDATVSTVTEETSTMTSPENDTTSVPSTTELATVPLATVPLATVPLPSVVYRPNEPVRPQELAATTPEWELLIHRGIEAVIDRCVAERGLRYTHRPDPLPQPTFVNGPRDGNYRALYGYGIPTGLRDTDERWAPFTAQLQNPTLNDLIMGSGNCQWRAYNEIYPPNGAAVAPANASFNDALGAVDTAMANDPVIAQTAAAWSDCMNSNGYQYISPAEAEMASSVNRDAKSPGQSRMDDEPTTEEVAIALADWNCQQMVGYVDQLWGTLQTFTAAFAKDHGDLIADIKAWQQQVAVRAQAAIDRLPSSSKP